MIPLAAVAATVAVYACCLRLHAWLGQHPLANPTLATILVVAASLRLAGIDAGAYARGAWPLVMLLGPATVALGVPLAANLPAIRRNLAGVALGVLGGVLVAGVSAVLILRACGVDAAIARAMLPKTATTPIAMGVAGGLGGDPSLAATFAIASGLVVALALRPVLAALRIRGEAAAGLAAGVAGSGIGAASAARIGEEAAAFAAMGVGLTGLATALLAPLLARVLRLG